MKIRLHVNKNEIRKGVDGWPWTIHTSKACIKAKSVQITLPCYTEYKPLKRGNPKVFIVCEATRIYPEYSPLGNYLIV